jgi:hypothetical protein
MHAAPWPSWYPNAKDVVEGGASQLGFGVSFTWRTLGVAIRSSLLEFLPNERIAWNVLGIGVDAYHA